MKRIIILGIIMTSISGAGWQRVIGWSDKPLAPNKEVMKSDTAGVFIRTMFYGFSKNDTVIDNKNFQQITIPESELDRDTTRAGKPQIPYLRLLIAVPDSCGFNITVDPVNHTLFNNYLLYPIPRIDFEDSGGIISFKEVYTYDTTFYQKDTFFPNKYYEVKNDGHWRDQRVLEVFLYPVQFNPQKKLMYFYTGMNLKIEYTGKKFPNPNGLGPFEDIGREILLNYPGIDRSVPAPPPPSVHYYTDLLNPNNVADYIIVTHFDFLNNKTTEKWIWDFARWRVEHNRFDVGIVKVQDIYEQFTPHAPGFAAQLRDFLIYAYNNWKAYSSPDGHFAYCLFIGDWDYVPAKLSLYNNDTWLGADEMYFADIIPGPYYSADIVLGRWPVKEKKIEDLITIAQKTINYEKYPAGGDWRRKTLLIADCDASFDFHIENSKPVISLIEYDTIAVRKSSLTLEQFKDSLTKYFNEGEILALYWDHGDPSGWANYDTANLKELEVTTNLPVVMSNACLTAMFQWDHPFYGPNHPRPHSDSSFGELFLKIPGGAVAFWGATTYARMIDYLERLKIPFVYQNWILGLFAYTGETGGVVSGSYALLGDPALDLGDYTAYPDLPDLVIRPQEIDIELLSPYPYPNSGSIIPIKAAVWNIGHMPAYNIEVKIRIEHLDQLIWEGSTTISEIKTRSAASITVYWNTGQTHPGFYGKIGDCKFAVIADPNNKIEESWEYNNQSYIIKKVALYPYQSGWPKKVTGFSQPAIANLDGAGSVEIVYVSSDSVYVFDIQGNVLTGWPKYFEGAHSFVLGDVNHDGFVDIVAVSSTRLVVYDYQGNTLPNWPQQIPIADYTFIGLPALGYIDNTEQIEIIAIARQKPLFDDGLIKIFVYSNNGAVQHEFTSSSLVDGLTFPLSLSIANLMGGGNSEIIISYGYYRDNPNDGSDPFFYTEIFNMNGLQKTLEFGSNMAVPALADLDYPPDGYFETIIGANDKYIRAYKATTDQLLWARLTEGPINSSPAVGDIHPAPQYPGVEITFGNDGSAVNLREKSIGDPIPPWSYIISPSTMVRTSPAIANINGDRNLDIIIGANNQYIYAFKHTKDSIPPFPLPLFGQPSSPIIGDIDGDRKSEIILSSSDGYLHIWKNLNSMVPQYLLEWPQFHYDYQRTGLYGWSP